MRTCIACLRAYVPTCLAYFCTHVLTCFTCSYDHVSTCLACLRAQFEKCPALLSAYMPTCLACLPGHVLSCLTYPRAKVPCLVTCSRANVPFMPCLLKWQRALRKSITYHVQKVYKVFLSEIVLLHCLYWNEKILLNKVDARGVTRNTLGSDLSTISGINDFLKS